jgi:acetyl esterase/lipase
MDVELWPAGRLPGLDPSPGTAVPSLAVHHARVREPHPAVIVLPGGGYGGLAPHEAEPIASWLNSIGVSAFLLRYRVAPYRHPWPLADAQRAIRVARARAAEWGIEPSRIGILGFSAGGHLAISSGVLHDERCYEPVDDADAASPRPDFMVGCYPVVSFGPFGHHGSMLNLLGESPDPRLRRRLSLEESVDAQTSPAFLWHTADDEAVPVENSLLLGEALRRHRVPFELHVFPHGRHGLGLAPDRPDVAAWTELCARWILAQGGGMA